MWRCSVLIFCAWGISHGFAAGEKPVPPESLAVGYTLKQPGFITVIINDAEGQRARNLLACAWREAGAHYELWDGLDDAGQPVPPGEYRWEGLCHDGITARFQGSFNSPGNPPWMTNPLTARTGLGQPDRMAGGWLADHAPPKCVCAGNGYVFFGATLAETGDSLIQVTPDGQKVWGSLWRELAGADALACEKDVLYVAGEKGWMKDKLTVHRISLKGHQYLPNSEKADSNESTAAFIKVDSKKFADIRGLGVFQSWIVLSLADRNRLALFDRESGSFVRDAPLPATGGVARGTKDECYAISGKQVVRVDLEKGACQPVVTASLEQPRDLAVDQNGDFYVTDQAASEQCVKVFSANGQFLRCIGKRGGHKEGPFDPLTMNQPTGIAIDDRGQVWVAECDFAPKRISVWSRDGKFLRDFVGPPFYGGGGSLDPKEEGRAFYHGMAFEWGKWPSPSRLEAILFRPEEHPDLPLPADACLLDRAIRWEGRLYLASDFAPNLPCAFVGEVKDNHLIPRAILGSIQSLCKSWQTSHTTFIDKLNRQGMGQHSSNGVFLWSDANGDGKAQEEEVSIQRDWSFNSTWGLRIGENLELHATAANNALARIAPRKEASSLSYNLGDALLTPLPPGFEASNIVALASDSLGHYILNIQREKDGNPRNVILGLTAAGKARWTYPNPFPSNTHSSPLPEIGELRHTLDVEGFATLDGNLGEIFQLNGNKGARYLFTTDGLFVAQLQADARLAPSTRDLPLKEEVEREEAVNPKLFANGAPMVWRDMRLDQVSLQDECFFGWLGRIDHGPICQVVGKDSSNVTEVQGISTLKRLEGGIIKVTQESQARAEQIAEHPRQIRAIQMGGFSAGSNTDLLSFPSKNPVAGFRLTYDGSGLNLMVEVREGTPFVNQGQDWKTLFKSGDAVDFRFAAKPDLPAHRSEAGPGDIRLLLAMFNGKPVAVRYRYVVRGTENPEKFASPTGVAVVDRVTLMPEVEIKVDRKEKGYSLEAHIPWIVLGLADPPRGARRGDVGVLFSDPNGSQCVARYYYFDPESQVVADLPSEVKVDPSRWGEIEF